MGWLLNIMRFAQQHPFKCPKCGSKSGSFSSGDSGMRIRCNDCFAGEAFDMSQFKEEPKNQLPEKPENP